MHSQLIPLLTLLPHLTLGLRTEYVKVNLIEYPRNRYGNDSQVRPPDGRELQRRFIDVRDHVDSEKGRKIATHGTTTTESSFYDYFVDKDDDDDDDDDEEDKEDEEDDEEDYDDDDDDEKRKEKKKPPFLRGVRRKYVRAHKILFPLLMAYKLKFFTMLPLLVGSLVLLISTTGMAGFFFALFSAALGLQVKSHHN